MACGSCRRRKKNRDKDKQGSSAKFVLETNGKTQTFGSKLERDAHQVRYGGVIRG